MADKIALITGASRGIGAAVAVRLGAAGMQTVLLGRTVSGLEATDDAIRKAGGPPALIVPLDFAKAEHEFDHLGQQLYQKYGRIDILIGAAAHLGPLSPLGHLDPADWQKTVAVNLTANYRLIRSLDPLMRQSAAAIALFLSCSQASMPEAYWGAYGASKAALENLVTGYGIETQSFPIRAATFDPGPCATQLRAQAFPGEDQAKLPIPADVAAKLHIDLEKIGCQPSLASYYSSSASASGTSGSAGTA